MVSDTPAVVIACLRPVGTIPGRPQGALRTGKGHWMASDLLAGPTPAGPPRPKKDGRLLVAAVAMVFVFSLAIMAVPAGRTRLGFDDAYWWSRSWQASGSSTGGTGQAWRRPSAWP